MGHFVSENKGGDYERVPLGMQAAVAARVYDLGVQPGYQGGRPHQKYVILWELSERMTKGDFAGQRFRVSKTYTASLGSADKPSNLRKDLTSWRTRDFTPDELAKFDLDKIVGVNCTLNLVEKAKSDGRKYANIAAIMPPLKGADKLKPETPEGYVPEWVQEAIDNQLPPEATETYTVPTNGTDAGVANDDIPF